MRGRRGEAYLHVAAIIVIGLAYRATFISQGFNATDEGWLQSVGRRIVLGQVPYRDFDFVFPRTPFTIFKEAALVALLGDSYTLLVQRWIFVCETTLGSVIAYLILRRFVSDRVAFLVALPTIFFSVLSYYFSFYTYDGAILLLIATLFLTMVTPTRTWPAWAAGAFTCLSGLAKPNYFEFAVLVPLLGVVSARAISRMHAHPALYGLQHRWPQFLGGLAVTLAVVVLLFAAAGAAPALLKWPFPAPIRISSSQASSSALWQLGFAIWQDLPTAFTSRELKLFALVLALLVLACIRALKRVRWLALMAIPVGLAAYAYRYGADFIPMAMGLVLVIGGFGLVLSLVVRIPAIASLPGAGALRGAMPLPELIVLALSQQYFSQFSTSGIAYSYLGAFLSVPVALLTLRGLGRAISVDATGDRVVSWSALSPTLLALWLVGLSVIYVQNHVYFDAPRSQLTASFKSAKLAGITSTPANVRRIDGLVKVIDEYSKPGDPILVMPDLSAIYYLTDRVNPTRQDWLGYIDLTPGEETPLQDVQKNRPRVVIVQSVSEYDWARSGRADYVVDYTQTGLAPLYEYLMQNYVQVATVDDISVLVPRAP